MRRFSPSRPAAAAAPAAAAWSAQPVVPAGRAANRGSSSSSRVKGLRSQGRCAPSICSGWRGGGGGGAPASAMAPGELSAALRSQVQLQDLRGASGRRLAECSAARDNWDSFRQLIKIWRGAQARKKVPAPPCMLAGAHHRRSPSRRHGAQSVQAYCLPSSTQPAASRDFNGWNQWRRC